MKRYPFLAAMVLLSVMSCKKANEQSLEADFKVSDELSMFALKSNATSGNGGPLKYQWSLSTDTIELAGNTAATAFITLPIINEAKLVTVTLKVSDNATSKTISKEITLPQNAYQRSNGLGKDLSKSVSNDRDYLWYATQYNTGIYANDNCGPTLATMTAKWIAKDFSQTPEQARALYKPNGGWWNTSDIISYLNRYNISNKTISLNQINAIQTHIDNGNLVILCLDHFYIRKESNTNWHLDKFYNSSGVGAGDFIIVKGYKVVDDHVLYEAYDPGGQGGKYPNGIYKGRDRYYRAEDLADATTNWWKYAIIVSKGSLNNVKGVDIQQISHQSGN